MNETIKCKNCDGAGYYAGHADTPHENGACDGSCPVQYQCELCQATGLVNLS